MPNYEILEDLLRRANDSAPNPLILPVGYSLKPREREELQHLRELVDAGLMSFYGQDNHRAHLKKLGRNLIARMDNEGNADCLRPHFED